MAISAEVKKDLDDITDLVYGGRGPYMRLMGLIKAIDEKASEGDPKAIEGLDVIRKFANLCRYARSAI